MIKEWDRCLLSCFSVSEQIDCRKVKGPEVTTADPNLHLHLLSRETEMSLRPFHTVPFKTCHVMENVPWNLDCEQWCISAARNRVLRLMFQQENESSCIMKSLIVSNFGGTKSSLIFTLTFSSTRNIISSPTDDSVDCINSPEMHIALSYHMISGFTLSFPFFFLEIWAFCNSNHMFFSGWVSNNGQGLEYTGWVFLQIP